MAWVVFFRGVNVGGHRRFRPAQLARRLAHLDVINIGAAGTLVVRRAVGAEELRAQIRGCLPFDTELMLCRSREIGQLVANPPFAAGPAPGNTVRFVSILAARPASRHTAPLQLPPTGPWLVRIMSIRGRFVVGVYRRRMQAIGALGRLDRLFGVAVTTRSWSTLEKVAALL